MAEMSIDGVVYQVRIKWLIEGQACYNVLSFVNRGSQDLVTNLLQPILTCVKDNLIPVLSNSVTLLGADCKQLTGTVAQEVEVVEDTGNVGEAAGGAMPSGIAAVIALKSAQAGKSGKGRMYLPGIDEEHADGSTLDATFIAAAVAFIACMILAFHDTDPLATPKFHWSIHSRKNNTYYPIETGAPRSTLSYLRSRKAGT